MDKNEFIGIFDSLIFNTSTRDYYGQKEFFNVGYWHSDTQNQHEAVRIYAKQAVKYPRCWLRFGSNYQSSP